MSKNTTKYQRKRHRETRGCQGKIGEIQTENYLTRNKNEKYNIFFFDPPFSDEKFKENLKSIRIFKNFLKNHLVIIHRERAAQDDFKSEINILKIKIYGRSKIFFGVFY